METAIDTHIAQSRITVYCIALQLYHGFIWGGGGQHWDSTLPQKCENYDVIIASTAIIGSTIIVAESDVSKHVENFIKIYENLVDALTHTCTLCMQLHPPT